ncbi:MAG: molecular chaperone GrpE [Micromonosporaceae bacterium]
MPGKPARLRGWLGREQPAPPPVDTAATAERAALVRTCIYVRDRVTSVALAQRLDQGLADVGVDLVDPTGERFDPGRHEAAGTLPTHDPALVGTVATVEVPGYADRGVLVRVPVVTVYQAGDPA